MVMKNGFVMFLVEFFVGLGSFLSFMATLGDVNFILYLRVLTKMIP